MNAAGGSGEPEETALATPMATGPARPAPRGPYEPPSVTYLGTLRELTLGGASGPDDGVGGAGGIGSL
jgi:hypothetical protein